MDIFQQIINFIGELFLKFFEWIKELFEWIGQTIWAGLLDALASVIESISMPDWYTNVSFDIPATVSYFFEIFEVSFGAGVIASAYMIRFLIRRIPLIG